MAGVEVVREFINERRSIGSTLREVGPDAPTLAGTWTTRDLAAHLMATEQLAGLPTFIGRTLVARFAWRLNDRLSSASQRDIKRFRRRGFTAALDHLAQDPPRLLRRATIGPVSLFEVWVHHEDVRRANGLTRRDDGTTDLVPCLEWLIRYQRRPLGGIRLRVDLAGGQSVGHGADPNVVTIRGTAGDCLLWLAGRRQAATVELDGTSDLAAQLSALDLRI